MKIQYRLKMEFIMDIDEHKDVVIKSAFVCDPEKNTECRKTGCGTDCNMTTNPEYAKHFEIDE